jgi:uncharacterized RDD family membrane protein YckC
MSFCILSVIPTALSSVFVLLLFGFEFGEYPVFAVYPPPQIYKLAPLRAERIKLSLWAALLHGLVDNLSAYWTFASHIAD